MPVSQQFSKQDIAEVTVFEKHAAVFQYKNIFPLKFWETGKKPAEAWSQNWMAAAQENIRISEYNFVWEEKYNAYCTPNRKNNLRFFYNAKGFTVERRITQIPIGEFDPMARPDEIKYRNISNWKVKFNLDKKQVGKGAWVVTENKAEYITDKITVQYLNNDEGMRQNFIVLSPLSKSNTLKINFSIKTKLKTYLHGNQLQFFHKKTNVLNYEQLKVWDAKGTALEASIKKSKRNKFCIQVNTTNAVYPITIDPLSNTPDSTPDDANQANAYFGISVASAGDVNGDGYSDVIIGAEAYDDGAIADEGRAFVYHGSPAGLSATPNSTPDDADQISAYFGISVASAGDVNGDGYSDVIIGSYWYDDGANTNEGRAFVYYGSATGLPATPSNTPDDADQGFAWFGCSVASAGDVNGDGYSDVIIGAYRYDDGANTDEGRAFVYHGSATGLSASPNSTPDDANQAGAFFGISVASTGDVNGDGYSDVIIGADNYDDGPNIIEGRAFVYHGSATGISASPNSTPDDADQPGASFGHSVASAGDINGDGYSDVIIGAYNLSDGGNPNEGRAFVYHGSAIGLSATPNSTPDDADQAVAFFGFSVASAGDVNGDGYSDVIIGAKYYDDGANSDEGRAFVYHGSATGLSATPNSTPDDCNQALAEFGFCVASAGDVNGDGYSDVIIGAHYYNDGVNNFEGRAFLYHGSASGLSATPNSTPDDADQADSGFGYSVAAAGDVNGDGYSDVIIGADHFHDGGNSWEGRAFLYNGNDSTSNKRNNLRLYNSDLTTPINSSNFIFGNFGAGLFAKSFLGKVKGKMVWETRINYNAYSGNPITNSTLFTAQQSAYTDLGLTGIELKDVITKLLGSGIYTKLRARVKYDPVTAITGQVYGPWRNVSAVIDGNSLGALPIELISFDVAWLQKGKTAKINFTTGKESGICCFDIEKSPDGFTFYAIGSLQARNAPGVQSYSFIDNYANVKKQFYRLKIKGNTGRAEYSNIRLLQNNGATEILVFPNPTTDILQLKLNGAYDKMNVLVVNAAGLVVKRFNGLSASGQVLTIPVHHLPAGQYWLRLESADNKQVLRFVKQ